ncbi:MAG: transposase family protein [Okeania sp. SIO2D1]|nr:transposase family protein [Okeania sp. SIO2D1]
MKTPKKKPKNQELSSQEKIQNKELASERIFVEHIIRLLKIFRVAQERFRLNPDKYRQIIMTICGLVRLRIGTFIL